MAELSTTLTEAFDTANEEGSKDFPPLPKGQYVASITKAEVGALKSGKGQAISATWEVEGGEHASRPDIRQDNRLTRKRRRDEVRPTKAERHRRGVRCDRPNHRPVGAAEQAVLDFREDRGG